MTKRHQWLIAAFTFPFMIAAISMAASLRVIIS